MDFSYAWDTIRYSKVHFEVKLCDVWNVFPPMASMIVLGVSNQSTLSPALTKIKQDIMTTKDK